jgi:hypothetical protein
LTPASPDHGTASESLARHDVDPLDPNILGRYAQFLADDVRGRGHGGGDVVVGSLPSPDNDDRTLIS